MGRERELKEEWRGANYEEKGGWNGEGIWDKICHSPPLLAQTWWPRLHRPLPHHLRPRHASSWYILNISTFFPSDSSRLSYISWTVLGSSGSDADRDAVSPHHRWRQSSTIGTLGVPSREERKFFHVSKYQTNQPTKIWIEVDDQVYDMH